MLTDVGGVVLFLIADAQGSHEGGLVRKVQDREAPRASGNCEYQQGGNTSAVGRCVRSLRCYVIESFRSCALTRVYTALQISESSSYIYLWPSLSSHLVLSSYTLGVKLSIYLSFIGSPFTPHASSISFIHNPHIPAFYNAHDIFYIIPPHCAYLLIYCCLAFHNPSVLGLRSPSWLILLRSCFCASAILVYGYASHLFLVLSLPGCLGQNDNALSWHSLTK